MGWATKYAWFFQVSHSEDSLSSPASRQLGQTNRPLSQWCLTTGRPQKEKPNGLGVPHQEKTKDWQCCGFEIPFNKFIPMWNTLNICKFPVLNHWFWGGVLYQLGGTHIMGKPGLQIYFGYQGPQRTLDPQGVVPISCPQWRLLIFLRVPRHKLHGFVHPDVGDGKVSIVSLAIVNPIWLVGLSPPPPPLWKMMEFVSWDDDIPNWIGKIIQMFQTTNPILYTMKE